MAVWEDPLDDLIAELERVVPPEPPEKKPAPEELQQRFFARLQADAARIVFSPEATLDEPDEAAAPPAPLGPTGVPPQAPVANPDSVSAQLVSLDPGERRGQRLKHLGPGATERRDSITP